MRVSRLSVDARVKPEHDNPGEGQGSTHPPLFAALDYRNKSGNDGRICNKRLNVKGRNTHIPALGQALRGALC